MLTFKSLKFKFAALNLHIQEYVEFANSLEGTLVLRKPLDFESERQLNVSIRAQDQGNPPLYNETYVIIRVQDADDQNPLFSRPRYVAYLPQPAVKVIHLCKFLDLNTGNCFNCSQNRIIKNIKNVPGKKIAIPEIIPPNICPINPNDFIENAPK